MAIRDLKNRMMWAFSRMAGDTTRRPDGGTSFYRPIGKKKQEAAENPARAAAPETPYLCSRQTCRAASRKGWLSISPVVPPISVMTTSAFVSAPTW